MSFEIRRDTYGTVDIYRGGHPVGRIRGHRIELHGFWDRVDAERALQAVSEALARWLPLQRFDAGVNRRIDLTPLWPDRAVLGFEILLPQGIGADQVLRAARVAYHAAFQGGSRYNGTRYVPQAGTAGAAA